MADTKKLIADTIRILREEQGKLVKAIMALEEIYGGHEQVELFAIKGISEGQVSHVEAAEKVLKNAGEPLKTAEIYNRMIQSGFNFTIKKPGQAKASLYTTMVRKKDSSGKLVFRKIGPGTFALVEWDTQKKAP